jgi:filamentous hemagglutinin
VAAVGAFAIGNAQPDLNEAEYLAAHAALGCAASAARGTGCGGGAIGGAVSAGLNPIINSSGNLSPAALAAVETLVSGSVAGALGLNVQGAVTAAQNETLNNFCEHNSCGKWLTAVANNVSNALNAGADVPAMESAAGTDVLAGIGNTALNAATFSLPGMPDYVPYFQYSNPALGALGELYGTFGLGTLASSAFAESVATNSGVPSSLSGLANPNSIRFTQSSIGSTFSDGSSLQDAIGALESGVLSPSDLPPIRVYEQGGQIYTLDNRRLFVTSQAGTTVNITPATAQEITSQAWKFTTPNQGCIVCIRGGPKP